MINFILQAIQKKRLTTLLSKNGCMFLVDNKSNDYAENKIRNLLKKEDSLRVVVSEAAKKPFIEKQNGFILFKNINKNKLSLIADSHISPLRQSLFLDMRLYGADMDSFCENNDCNQELINWQKTTKETLYIYHNKDNIELLKKYFQDPSMGKEKPKTQKEELQGVFNLYTTTKEGKKLKTLNADDYAYLLSKPTKKQKKKYWSKTMLLILSFTMLIIYLYHFY